MANEVSYFRSELKQQYNLWERKLTNVNQEIYRVSETRKKVDVKPGFIL